jgi:hypothetical protein
LLRAIASVHRDEAGAYQDLLTYGQYVGREVCSGALKQLMLVSTLKLFAKKLPELWARDHQRDGKLESDISQLEDSRLGLQLSGIRGYDHVGVVTLGWLRGAMASFTPKTVQIKQTGWSLANAAPSEMSCEVSWS